MDLVHAIGVVKVLETGFLCFSFDVVDGAVVGGDLGKRSQISQTGLLSSS